MQRRGAYGTFLFFWGLLMQQRFHFSSSFISRSHQGAYTGVLEYKYIFLDTNKKKDEKL